MYFYKLISNYGHGDTYYCKAWNIDHARSICGLNPKYQFNAIGGRISSKKYFQAKSIHGVHIY
jgi:hypothetical protein